MLAELRRVLDELEREPPKGLVIRSGKANGFIAGADVDEFGDIADATPTRWRSCSAAGTRSSGSRALPYPTLALIRGFCLGGGLELALACRYRVVVDEPSTRLGLPEVMLGIVPAWGGIKRLPRLVGAPAALDMLLTGKTIDARKREAHRPRRRVRAAAHHGQHRARRAAALGRRRARLPLPAVADAACRSRGDCIASAGAQAGARSARGASTIRRPTRSSSLWERYDGDALAPPPGDPASIAALLADADRRESHPRVPPAGAAEVARQGRGDIEVAHVHVVGAGTMGGDIAAWCALRGLTVTLQDQDARAARARDEARGEALRASG